MMLSPEMMRLFNSRAAAYVGLRLPASAVREMPGVHSETGHPGRRRHLADTAAYGTVHIDTAAGPSRGCRWKGMERSCPAKGAGGRGWVRGVLGAWFAFQPISRWFRNTSCHLPRAS